MKKVTKDEWLKSGIQALAAKGEQALTIDALCERLKVSKGSFYHHFKNIDDYVKSLLSYWEQINTKSIIEATERVEGFEMKVETLNAQVLSRNLELEVRIRAWGIRERPIGRTVQRVDDVRVRYLAKLYQQNGVVRKEALDLAALEYAAFVGAQMTLLHLPKHEFERLGNKFQSLIKNYLR